MKSFKTLTDAVELAATHCSQWIFAYSNKEVYDKKTLPAMAKIHDQEAPIDDSSFYVVSQSGAIGLLEEGEKIDWLFLSASRVNEALPVTFSPNTQIRFCPKCGSKADPGTRFCGKCGNRLTL